MSTKKASAWGPLIVLTALTAASHWFPAEVVVFLLYGIWLEVKKEL